MKSLHCQQMLGTSHCILKDAEFHLQEGRLVLPPQWNSPLPGLMVRSYRGHGLERSEPHTACDGPSIHVSARHEGNITHAAQHPTRSRRLPAGEKGDKEQPQDPLLSSLRRDRTSHDRRVGLVPWGRGRTTSGACR